LHKNKKKLKASNSLAAKGVFALLWHHKSLFIYDVTTHNDYSSM